MAKRGRPVCRRVVRNIPEVTYFKPRGVPMHGLELVVLTVEELEAVSLADLQGLEQEDAAEKMNVSRRTYARELSSGRRKIADALFNGKAIEIGGGNYVALPAGFFLCSDCGHVWKGAGESGGLKKCPKCSGSSIHKRG